jgi:hypothetical protein
MQPANTLKMERLDENWQDKDSVMLHACFQLLKDFVEQELRVNSFVDWNHTEKHKHAKAEIEELYSWWMTYDDNAFPDADADEKVRKLEDDMLHRLINVRWAMWT